MRVLIAEDSAFYRLMLQGTIADWGYEVVAVEDGLEAWELLRQRHPPELAVLDWEMPGLSGLEVCRKLRLLHRATPTYVLMLTAKEGKENTVAALEQGADDFISKPVDPHELRARLRVGERLVGLQAGLAERVGSLEDALAEAQRVESLGRLAGGAAHDFNNVLTIIGGYCDLLLGGGVALEKPAREMVEVIRQAGRRGSDLTRQLLAYARRQALNKARLSLNDVAAGAERLMSHLLRRGVRLTLELEPGLWEAEADASQLEQVLVNMILNAQDAMPAGGRITVATRNETVGDGPAAPGKVPPGGYAVLSVSDTGCGMDEATLSRVFEPFFTTKGPGKGTGLGLASAYGTVRQCGGFIEVRSEVGRGTTFTVYLPRHRPAACATAPAALHTVC